nr:DUF4142 domain-containing protein [Pseudomonas sp.]
MKSLHPAAALAFSAALISFSAHAQSTAPTTDTRPAQTTSQASQPAATTAERQSSLAQEDQTFLENAIQGSYAEIEGSQLALDTTTSSDVKSFAQMMIEDHGKMLKEAQALAQKKGMTPPTGPSVMQRTEITALKALSGGAFDAMYVNRIGVASHEATVEMFEDASQEVQDPDVKALATKTLPKLREHLEMARSLNQKQEKQ